MAKFVNNEPRFKVGDEFDSKIYDLCPDCFKSVISYVKNSAITSD